ncbi:MAG: DUF4384 domain-containing protein [Nitrospirae bacterium]|nr:DUF4384 domain-containing protein [Nitrospirota bacterium]
MKKLLLLIISCFIYISIFATSATPSESKNKTDVVKILAGIVENNLDKLPGKTIAVIPFSYPDGIKSMEGSLISERLITRLTEDGKVKVLERYMLEEALKEQKLNASGLVDPRLAVKLGKIIGAQGILSGTITDLGEKIEINARLFKVETGEVIAARTLRARKTIKTFISPLWDEINRIKQESPSFKARIWLDKDAYKIGDFLTVRFETDRDSYVTIFDFNTDGSVFILFPNRFVPNNRVKGGKTYTIPAEEDGYKIRVHGPAGLERLKLFATTKDIPLFTEDYSQSPFRSLSEDKRSTPRNLQAIIDNLEKNSWAESRVEFLIENVFRGGSYRR